MSKNRSIPLPPYVETAIKQLESHGFQAWCVGGCVRDSLLGNTPHDWDIATSALPEETLASFPGQRILQMGISHGTITLLPAEGTALEITTFRTESGYSDNRHPDQVRFSTSLEEDLSRRDFTVNAMAYHPVHGIVDPFGTWSRKLFAPLEIPVGVLPRMPCGFCVGCVLLLSFVSPSKATPLLPL